MQLIFPNYLDILNETLPHSPPSSTLVADAVCRVGVREHLSVCVCVCERARASRAFFIFSAEHMNGSSVRDGGADDFCS